MSEQQKCSKCGLNLMDAVAVDIRLLSHRATRFAGPDPQTVCAGTDSFPCVVRQLAQAREREKVEKERAEKAEADTRLHLMFCKTCKVWHDGEGPCPACNEVARLRERVLELSKLLPACEGDLAASGAREGGGS